MHHPLDDEAPSALATPNSLPSAPESEAPNSVDASPDVVPSSTPLPTPNVVPSLAELFFTFAKIGSFTIGGGYVILPLMERVVIRQKGWIDRTEFFERLTLSQAMPGIWAVNISLFVGFKVRGLAGAIVATLGSVLPSFLIILTIAIFFAQFRGNEWVEAAFRGIRPVVVALIAVPFINLCRELPRRIASYLMVLGVLLLMWFASVSPGWLILAVGSLAMLNTFVRTRKK